MLPLWKVTPEIERLIAAHTYDTLESLRGFSAVSEAKELINALPRLADRYELYSALSKDLVQSEIFGYAVRNNLDACITKYTHTPVDARTFLLDKEFLGKEGEVYPLLLPEFEEINSGKYSEAVLTGGIGTGKSTLAIWTIAYQLYLLSCYRDPHKIFGLERASEIIFVFQSITATHAKGIDYERFQQLMLSSPYFCERFAFNEDLLSQLNFPNRIQIKPISGKESAAIGANVFGGMIDEVNYMQVVEKSKQSVDRGTYDQAIALYNSISRRRKSRFMRFGQVPGIFCIVSSKRYPGQFTDVKELEAQKEIKESGHSTIYIYDKRLWEIAPDKYSGKTFRMFIGDLSRRPRIMRDDENVPETDAALVMDIPDEHRADFEKDPINALREIAGVSTLARHPFLVNQEAVTKCFNGPDSVLSEIEVDFSVQTLKVLPKRIINKDFPRYAHIDLGLTSDSAGLVIGHVDRFVSMKRGGNVREWLPHINIDCALRINPPKGGEINFEKIRTILYILRDNGMDIRWVSLDTFQSRDTMQILRGKGFTTGELSMDTSTIPYDVAKSAMYDTRVSCHDHPHLRLELASLERDTKKNKIDHPPSGSKDVADALAGVIFGLTMRREIWADFGYSPDDVPVSLQESVKKSETKMKTAAA